MNPNLCHSVKNGSLPSAFVKISASWYCVGTYEALIIPACNFSRTMWQFISMCFVRSWNTGFAAICNVAWLSQKNWASKLHGTFKSRDKYRNQTISKQVLAIARYSAFANDLDKFVCSFDFHEIIEEPRKNAIPRYWSLSLSRNKLSMSDCSRMAITIFVPVILWCTLAHKC